MSVVASSRIKHTHASTPAEFGVGMRRIIRIGLLAATGTLLAGVVQAATLIGISMPTKTSARWVADGDNMRKVFTQKGYAIDLQYADDDVPTQVSQIENMITKGAKVLVIGAIDAASLSNVLQRAAEKKIRVVSYDRLIRGTPYVDYYATFDNFQVGVLQGSAIVDRLGLKQGKGPFNIELFGGSPDDNNATFFYNGAMSVLDPYIKSGKLVVRSKQMGLDKVGTLGWVASAAQARMDNLLSAFYSKDRVDAVLVGNDDLALGVLSSLKSVGYGSGNRPYPVLVGQDANIPSIKAIIQGEQTMTVFKDTRELARVSATMVDALLSGKNPEINDTKTYNNGIKIVPSYLLKPLLVDKNNWEKILVQSGYYQKSQIQ